MAPRPAVLALRAVVRDAPILPFLYPVASRRLLSSTAPCRVDDRPKDQYLGQFDALLNNLPHKGGAPRTAPGSLRVLPTLQNDLFESDRLPRQAKRGSDPNEWAHRVQRTRNAFQQFGKATNGLETILEKHNLSTKKREELESQRPEFIDPEIFRHAAPLREGGYASPKDLTFEEYEKYLRNRRNHVREDIFEQLMENPLDHYKNFNLLKDFMTSAGRIKHRSITGLTNTNQRKLSKAIRRAVGIGLLPSVYRHPEVLKVEQKNAMSNNPIERDRRV